MSETTKVELKEEDRNLLRSTIESLKTAKAPKPAESKPEQESHPVHTIKELLDCPDCYPKVRKAVLEKEILSRKDFPYECEECGTRVKEEEESCPTCGGKEAKSR